MKDFVPVPVSALEKKLKPLDVYVLVYLLALRRFFGGSDEFTISDHDALNGVTDSRGRKNLPGCRLSPNTFKACRNRLIQRDYIRAERTRRKGHPAWKYLTVPGKAIVYGDERGQQLTGEQSIPETPYSSQAVESEADIAEPPTIDIERVSSPIECRDGRKRRGRNLSEDLEQIQVELIDYVDRLYRSTCGHPMPQRGRAMSEMKRFLLDNPTYNKEELYRCIEHRFLSEANPRQSLYKWIPSMYEYLDGPLEYGKPRVEYQLTEFMVRERSMRCKRGEVAVAPSIPVTNVAIPISGAEEEDDSIPF